MSNKFKILVLLLLLLLSISAVSAVDDNNETLNSDEAVSDTLEISEGIDDGVLEQNTDEEVLSAPKSYTVSESTYSRNFDNNGNFVRSGVNPGDNIKLSGSFSNKNFIFNMPLNIIGVSSDLRCSTVTLLSGASGSTVSNLNIQNNGYRAVGIFLNSASNCVINNCEIRNTGEAAYCICVANKSNYNNITNNHLTAYGQTYSHGTRSTSPLLVTGSHYNYITNNIVEADDANGIYLSSYGDSPMGGKSNYNTIFRNTVQINVLPTSWCYGIQVKGDRNTIKYNTVIGAYRGISTDGTANNIYYNTITNLTGADFNHINVETGGEYGIVGSYQSQIVGNEIINSKIINTGAGISGTDGTVINRNTVIVTGEGKGIVAPGASVTIKNNIISTESGSGVNQKDEVSGLYVSGNNITSISGVGILVEKLSSKRMPSYVTIVGNTIKTGNKYAIDASGVQADTSNINPKDNTIIGNSLVSLPAGVFDASKPTYIYSGNQIIITNSNYDTYINANGGLTSEVKDGDILDFRGNFQNKVIYVTKGVKITSTRQNALFTNSTFKVTSGNVLIENIKIINNAANRVNAWGIFVNQASGVRISNNDISVKDPKAAYAIYVLQSNYVDVYNNKLTSDGDYLTYTLLSYASEDCSFENNTIYTKGTGENYNFKPELCIDGNEIVIDGKSYCIDGNEVVIDGQRYCLDGNELVIDGTTYCLDGNELTIDGTTYCLDGNEVVIDGQRYCLDGNELTIDGTTYCLDGNELVIDGVSVCLDGNEVVIDGTTYCLDGNEFSVNGTTYCIDGNELSINGNSFNTGTAHVVSEIYRTYGILLLYSSNNAVSGNKVNVTSKLAKKYPTTGATSSTNSLVGIDVYFNSHNNTFSNNDVYVTGKDNYIYGMGVLGYNTGHSAPEGQGATNTVFDSNKITLAGGPYCQEGIIVGHESWGTIIRNNVIDNNGVVTYGIYLEMSSNTTIDNNSVILKGQAVYGIEGFQSNNNIVTNNVVTASGRQTYAVIFSSGNNTVISSNKINSNGDGRDLTITVLDSIGTGNAGVYLKGNSYSNVIEENEIYSKKGYAVLVDASATGNVISDNYLDSEKGSGNKGVSNSNNNNVSDNYKYTVTPTSNSPVVPYLGTGNFALTFNDQCNGGFLKIYDVDGNQIVDTKVRYGVANFNYKFDSSYVPATYAFTGIFTKNNFKDTEFEIIFTITKGNIVLSVPEVSAFNGETAKFTATVLDTLGNPIKGATVEFNRKNSVGRLTPMGSTTSDNNGVATLNFDVSDALDLGDYDVVANVKQVPNYKDAEANSKLSVISSAGVTISINSYVGPGGIIATIKYSNGTAIKNKVLEVKIGKYWNTLVSDKNGYIYLPSSFGNGVYSIKIYTNGQDKYNVATAIKTVTVKPLIEGSKDLSAGVGASVTHTVRIVGTDGNYVGAGKVITFVVNGVSSTAKTDSNGYATYTAKFNSAGTYTIVTKWKGTQVTNKIVVK
ncbi:right-handed parallel beta-helix repeat-containing protein [Methanobrevibacter sp.]